MTSGTVGYTDTRGNKDYTSIIASQIGKRLRQASDMASDERAFAEQKAEAGGTSLSEAGIGKGYFFGRALGNRFGGDRIARTKGRMGVGGAANNPAASYKQRFRGNFDYNVTNQVANITDTTEISNSVVQGLRGVQGGLIQVAMAISRQDSTMDSLANTQADMAKAIMFNGYLFQMFMSQQKAKSGRSSANREERRIEGRRGGGGGIGGASFGGAGGRRGMINVTGGSSGSGGLNTIKRASRGQSVAGALGSYAQSQFVKGSQTAIGTGKAITKFAPSFALDQTAVAGKSSADLAQILAGKTDFIGEQVGKRVGASPNVVNAITGYITEKLPVLKSTKLVDDILGNQNTLDLAKEVLGKNASPESILMMSKTLSPGGMGKNVSVLHDAVTNFSQGSNILKRKDLGASYLMDEMIKIKSGMGFADFLSMKDRFGTKEARRLMNLGFIESDSRIVQQISKKFKGVPFKDPMQAVAVTEIANRVDKGMSAADAIEDVVGIYGPGIKNAIAGASEMIPAKSNLAKALAKSTGKVASKSLLKSVLKQIPVIAGVAGVVFGIKRLLEGDLLGAGLEITSGLLGATGTTPGLGLAIDGFLLGRDLGVMPMAKGGTGSLSSLLGPSILNQATLAGFAGNNAVVGGEAGKEAFIPLEGTEGEIAGSVFGEANAISFLKFLRKQKTIDDLRYDSEDGIDQKNPFTPGSILYRNFERMRQYDMQGLEISKNMSGVTDNNADAFKLSSQRAVNQEMIVTAPIVNNYYNNGGGGGDGATRDEVQGAPFASLDLQEYYAKMGASRRS